MDIKSPIFAISFHVSGSTPLYMPLLLTTMTITGRLYLLIIRNLERTRFSDESYIKVVCPPAHGLHLHTREAKGAVSLHADDPLAFTAAALLHSCCSDCKTEADSHCSESSSIQPVVCDMLYYIGHVLIVIRGSWKERSMKLFSKGQFIVSLLLLLFFGVVIFVINVC